MIIRFDKPTGQELNFPLTNQFFDEKFINQNVITENLSRVFICGPPIFNKIIPCTLRSRIANEKIMLV